MLAFAYRTPNPQSPQAAREKMIAEKHKLLADGYLSEKEIAFFMRKYK